MWCSLYCPPPDLSKVSEEDTLPFWVPDHLGTRSSGWSLLLPLFCFVRKKGLKEEPQRTEEYIRKTQKQMCSGGEDRQEVARASQADRAD